MQSRAISRVNSIIDAAADILANDGYHAMSTNRVARKAGVSIGSVYQYFRNKEDILRAISERQSQECFTKLSGKLVGAENMPLDELVARFVDSMFETHKKNPKLLRALASNVEQVAPDLRNHFMQRAIAAVTVFLRMRSNELAINDPELTAFVLVTSINELSSRAMRRDDIDPEEFKREIATLIMRYLVPTN